MTDTEYIRLSLSLTEKEKADLDRYAKGCGLSRNEFIRQLILGKTPRPKQPEEFWAFMDVLYDIHNKLRENGKNDPDVLALCEKIERLVLVLQENI